MSTIRNILTLCFSLVLGLCLPAWTAAQITLQCPQDIDWCILSNDCQRDFELGFPEVTTTCPQNGLVLTYSGDLGSGPLPTSGALLPSVEIGGVYQVTITATDDCGNTANCNFTIRGYDCYPPVLVCNNNLTFNLLPVLPATDADGDGDLDFGTVTILTADMLIPNQSDCSGPIQYSIYRSEDVLAGTVIPEPGHSTLVLTCDDAGATVNVSLYGWDSAFNPYAVQPNGVVGGPNFNTCFSYIILQDDLEICNQHVIYGTILTPGGLPVAGANVEITNGTETFIATTNGAGHYEQQVMAGGDYSIRPHSNSDYTIGVNAADLAALQAHLENTTLLNSPYKILAGDVDGNNTLDTADALLLGDLINGLIDYFPESSWRFISTSYVFPAPENPFLQPVPEELNFTDLSGSVQADFIGFKVGDVNGDASPMLVPLTGIQGSAYANALADCVVNTADPVLKNWVVMAVGGNETYYTTTDTSGMYNLPLAPGDYELSLIAINESWISCHNNVPVTVDEDSYVTQSVSAKAQYSCAVPTVDIATPLLRRCFPNYFTVSFANNGPALLEDATVEVMLDSYLEMTYSSIPRTLTGPDTYTFEVGDLAPSQSGVFYFQALLSCESVLGQTHCTTARILPDDLCLPIEQAWDGPVLKLSGFCDNDVLRFKIENTGADMQQPTRYYVIEDDLIMMNEPIQLPGGQSDEIQLPANGSTYRVIVEQVPGYPIPEEPTLAIEACGTNGAGGFSTGFFTQFPEDEDGPAVSVYCAENIGSYDPNDKQGFPKGVGEQHFIEPGQALDYLIRFQNTGTDTAFTVAIRDTLSDLLDPATLQMGATSHPCTWRLKNNELIVTFNNILLPDSTTNEPASHGFVSFRIQQKPEVEPGSVIRNQASIYFDFNEPVVTNQTTHTIAVDFLETAVAVKEPAQEVHWMQVSPNPLKAGQPFFIGNTLPENGLLVFYNATGKPIATMSTNGEKTATLPAGIPSGWYLLEMRSENRIIGRGQVVVAQ